jgi:acetylornithine/succinyldiaminopimelate/putrescine aminotransferase
MIPNHDHLFDHVRGLGLMLGIKLKDRPRRAPSWRICATITAC